MGVYILGSPPASSTSQSIKSAAKALARGCKSYYTGDNPGDVPGNLPPPYYWWEAGALFGAFIDYWFYTGDDTYNDITMQAMVHQASHDRDFMPTNQTRAEGNDDQAFWAMTAMSAAERNFPNPQPDQPQWLALVQAVFNLQVGRWDKGACGGGLRWQIFRFNNGFNYKNTISNGCFFNMAARLATYTGNETYAKGAKLQGAGRERFDRVPVNITDGKDKTNNSDKWKTRVQGIVDGLDVFFFNNTNIMFEVACEPNGKCETDQRSFKAYLARWMAATTQVAPFTAEQLLPKLRASAMAAAKVCTGTTVGQQCPLKWTTETFEGETGLGEQMAALEVIQSNLISKTPPPLTNLTGGTSRGDPNAGLQRGRGDQTPDIATRKITAGDRAGAVILTVLLILVLLVSPYWLLCV
ncbi:uncharacterized protein PADG_00193 [Paracoccidioides brasiliensis Pb18]|uniref:Mannan endo-1,6-alpha-mannosidase n=1 Tax=Paracoccidioides brasiliensis (strain Pb18) TaxID=502780 RepID=C1G003_PARBD|nr:uncharacterized protein PADG_00193 [Paracoccidioides brasiliensis Pb18]EEH43904.2 hypothetical protein PADG_00193 [Paracoccidioides brasiliensis Pb18]